MRVFHLITEGYAGDFGKEVTKYRIDEVSRFIHNALFLSHNIRRDVTVKITFTQGPLAPITITINGSTVKGLHPDERSIAGYIRKMIKEGRYEKGIMWKEGVVLSEEGERRWEGVPYFYIGGPYGFPVDPPYRKVSLGGTVYTASQTVTILNFLMDVGLWKTVE